MRKQSTSLGNPNIRTNLDAISVINRTVTNTVTLGSAVYASSLTIGIQGDVAPAIARAVAVYMPASLRTTLTNVGKINGGASVTDGLNMYGGDGVFSATNDVIVNSGKISGGADRDRSPISWPGEGGVGIDLASGGTLTNSGDISGGGLQLSRHTKRRPRSDAWRQRS